MLSLCWSHSYSLKCLFYSFFFTVCPQTTEVMDKLNNPNYEAALCMKEKCVCFLGLLSLTELRWLHALLKEAKPSYKFPPLHEEGPRLSPAAYSLWDLLTSRLLQYREWPNPPAMYISISNSPQAKPSTHWMFLLLTGHWTPHLKMPVWCWQRSRSQDFQGLMFILITPFLLTPNI